MITLLMLGILTLGITGMIEYYSAGFPFVSLIAIIIVVIYFSYKLYKEHNANKVAKLDTKLKKEQLKQIKDKEVQTEEKDK